MWNPGVTQDGIVSLPLKEERLWWGFNTVMNKNPSSNQNIQSRCNWNRRWVVKQHKLLGLCVPPKHGTNFRLYENKTKSHSATYTSRSSKNTTVWILPGSFFTNGPKPCVVLFFKVKSPQDMGNSDCLPRKQLWSQEIRVWKDLFSLYGPIPFVLCVRNSMNFVYVE